MYRLDSFEGQLQLCAFGIETSVVGSATVTEYKGKKGDSVIWLDSRTLPREINVFLGLVEVGGYRAMLPIHLISDVRMVHLVTSKPWIYVMVLATAPRVTAV